MLTDHQRPVLDLLDLSADNMDGCRDSGLHNKELHSTISGRIFGLERLLSLIWPQCLHGVHKCTTIGIQLEPKNKDD